MPSDITGIVAFGDSLSDTGNTFLAAGSPPAPYYQGHYSNGPIWLEYLASPPGSCRPHARAWPAGLDNAWGGAQTGDGTSFMGTPNIGTQIAAFLGSGQTLSSTQLITIWGGANDFLNAGVTDPTIPVANLASEITTLAAAGGKQFLVPNLPLLGELPATNTLPMAQRQGLDGLSLAFDGLLAAKLTQLQTTSASPSISSTSRASSRTSWPTRAPTASPTSPPRPSATACWAQTATSSGTASIPRPPPRN